MKPLEKIAYLRDKFDTVSEMDPKDMALAAALLYARDMIPLLDIAEAALLHAPVNHLFEDLAVGI